MSSLFLENFGDFAGYFGNRRNLLCEFVVNDARVMPGRRYLRLSFLSPVQPLQERPERCDLGRRLPLNP